MDLELTPCTGNSHKTLTTSRKMEPITHAYFQPPDDQHGDNQAVTGGDELAQDGSPSTSRSSEYTSGYDSESDEDDDEAEDSLDEQQDEEEDSQAPTFPVPSRTIAAVEHPFLVMNQANALESFGPTPQYSSVS